MNDNMKLWESAFKTDPSEVKGIIGKDYKGNSPKPYYIVRRLTETFGPCGKGWGFSVVSERFETFETSGESLHVAHIDFWWREEAEHSNNYGIHHIQQMGQTKANYKTRDGAWKMDEDAPKKSVTDALVKAASYLGFAGDIFSGRWDDSKYLAELNQEFGAGKPAITMPQPKPAPMPTPPPTPYPAGPQAEAHDAFDGVKVTKHYPKRDNKPHGFVFSDGNKASTFSDSIAANVKKYMDADAPCRPIFERNGQYLNLVGVEPVE